MPPARPPPAAAVRGVRPLALSAVCGAAGTLAFADFSSLPFFPKRHFVVAAPPAGARRGGHAHRRTSMVLQCVAGSVALRFDDGVGRVEIVLDAARPHDAVLVGPLVWGTQDYGPGAVLLALCSEEHDEAEYVRDRAEFEELVGVAGRAKEAGEDSGYGSAESDVSSVEGVRETAPATPAAPAPEPSSALVPAAAPREPRIPFLDAKKAALMVEPALLASFRRVLHSGRYVLGPEVESFERAWAEYCGTVHCVGVASGLAALALMLAAPGIGEGDEVIVAANTYIATVLAVSRVGATPVFVEPDPATRNLDPAAAERAITPKTRAILSVDLYGHPAPYPELASLAARRNLLFFSDAAQSHGARVRGRPIASWCHAAAFSFYPSKNLGALGEAGAVVTSDPQLAEKIAALRNYGSRSRYVHDLVGSNERMDPLQAAFLMDKLPHLDALNARRREVARKYLDLLRGTPGLGLPPDPGPGDAEPSWHLFAATHPRRDALIAHLAGRGIDALVHYPVPPHLSGAYAGMGLGRGAFPAAEKLADEVVSLPCCPFMDDGMVGRVVEAVREFAGGDRGGEGS